MAVYAVYDEVHGEGMFRVRVYHDSEYGKYYARIFHNDSGIESATSSWYAMWDAPFVPSALGWARKTIREWGYRF